MTYVVVTIKKIKDLEAFRDYAVRVAPIVERHGGKYVAVDKTPDVRSGEWPYVRTVIVAYPNFTAAQQWYDSPEYQEIVPRTPARSRSASWPIFRKRPPCARDPRRRNATAFSFHQHPYVIAGVPRFAIRIRHQKTIRASQRRNVARALPRLRRNRRAVGT